MSTFFSVAVSLDGFMAGPHQTRADPLGRGGEQLHDWMFDETLQGPEDARIIAEYGASAGAGVMGRNMFSWGRGVWDPEWKGWWGDTPPYGVPVFVLTHHARESVEMDGGTVFHFVTGGFEVAYAQAREAAGDRDVQIYGGASTIIQALNGGVVDRFTLHHKPILLGAGERIFESVDPQAFALDGVVASPHVTHVTYVRGVLDLLDLEQ